MSFLEAQSLTKQNRKKETEEEGRGRGRESERGKTKKPHWLPGGVRLPHRPLLEPGPDRLRDNPGASGPPAGTAPPAPTKSSTREGPEHEKL